MSDGDNGADGADGVDGLALKMLFDAISYPTTDAQKRENRASTEVTVDDTTYAIGYKSLMRTGDELPLLGGATGETATFAALMDKDGNPINVYREVPDMQPTTVCTNGSGPDHTSMLINNGKLFAVTQLECSVGGAYVTELNQDPASGELSAVATRPVDFSGVNGTYVNCAGVTTPWNTHLGSEEYEPPMAIFDASRASILSQISTISDAEQFPLWFSTDDGYEDHPWHSLHIEQIAKYNGLENNADNAAKIGYFYGWIPEISITSDTGDTSVVKHYAMGRAAREVAYVMPDKRTVYLSDDGTNVGLTMFVADTAEDLSAGTLYAAHWVQETAGGAGSAAIEWINLGHASDAEIASAVGTTKFGDMFDKDVVDCTSVTSYDAGTVCVTLKAGMEKIASRLETRLYAGYKGATNEFRKEEGITFNPDDGVLYVAMTEVAKGMTDGTGDIAVEGNSCGAVYGMDVTTDAKDTDGNAIDSDYVADNMYGVVEGVPLTAGEYDGTIYEGNTCSINGIASPDNVSYLPKYGMLLIGEDTSKHENDLIWAYDVNSMQLQRIASTPYGSETTSPFWHTNINGYGYATMVTQHPFGESDSDKATSAADFESYVGYIGPFPALDGK